MDLFMWVWRLKRRMFTQVAPAKARGKTASRPTSNGGANARWRVLKLDVGRWMLDVLPFLVLFSSFILHLSSFPMLPRPPSTVIESVSPLIEGGRYPVKRAVGEDLIVEADVFKDGHDVISALLKW